MKRKTIVPLAILMGIILTIGIPVGQFAGEYAILKNAAARAGMDDGFTIWPMIPAKYTRPCGHLAGKDSAETAAKGWIRAVYGEEEQKLESVYDEGSGVWILSGVLEQPPRDPDGTEYYAMGGVPHVIIRSFDGKVLAVWHTK